MPDTRRPPRLGRSTLPGRIVAALVAVNLIAVVVTALVAFPLVQHAAENQARRQLTTQARNLVNAREPGGAPTAPTSSPYGDRFAVVSPDGSVAGAAHDEVDAATVTDLRAGRAVSSTTTLRGKEAVLIGIPTSDGGGVVGVRRVADIAAGNADLMRWLVLSLAVGLVAATIAGVVVARRVGRPLRRVAASARALAEGHRGVVVHPESIAEIADISHALTGLDAALTTSEHRQREFLLSVSHEIRTPLTALRGYAEALADGVVPPQEVAAVGRTLTAESERLRRFVDDLLELARLEADEFAVHPRTFDARATIAGVVAAWTGAASRSRVELRAEVPEAPTPVTTDEMRLRQVLDGLVENALRVTVEGAPIVLSVAARGDRVVLTVRDGGPGLTVDDAAVAFDRGALHARYREVRSVGTGLGLSIAHRLVTRLGGEIGVGTAPEGGAAFTVSIPAATDDDVRAALPFPYTAPTIG